MDVELIGVPHTSMAAPGGIARAVEVLTSAGMVERMRAAVRSTTPVIPYFEEISDGLQRLAAGRTGGPSRPRRLNARTSAHGAGESGQLRVRTKSPGSL
jgi:hypothetical protein